MSSRSRNPLPTRGQLRAPGAVLLVSTYDLGRQPLALAALAGNLGAAGIRPVCIDTSLGSGSDLLTDTDIAGARFVGISVPMHTALRLGMGVAERVRAINPTCHLCFFGLYAQLNADALAPIADSVIGAEPTAALTQMLLGQAPDATTPDRRGLPELRRYVRLRVGDSERLTGTVETTRGCKYHCTHCPIPPVYDGRLVVVPRAAVLADIRQLVAMGAEHITFADPDFFNGPRHSLRIVTAMHEEHPHLTYDATIKVEHIVRTPQLFAELAATGCIFVVAAVESLNDAVLTHLDKGHTRRDVFAALRILRDAGIHMRPTFVPFTPWASRRDYIELIRMIAAEGLVDNVDPVQLAIRLLVPPGSLLADAPIFTRHVTALDGAGFTYRWRHPDATMDALHGEVTGIVETAAHRGDDPAATFARIEQAALAAPGAATPTRWQRAQRQRPPRLTEAWFC